MNTPNTNPDSEATPDFVAAPVIARHLSVTPRYILQLAAEGRIPCIRLGKKCVRFDATAVAAALGIQWKTAQ